MRMTYLELIRDSEFKLSRNQITLGEYGELIKPARREIIPEGKWIINNNDDAGEGYYICSNCKNDVYDITDFCPNCGADMRERVDKE